MGGEPMAAPPLDPDTVRRKLVAKRANERTKSIYAFANTLGAATITTAAIAPSINLQAGRIDLDTPTWIAFGLSLHIFGWAMIRFFWESEE